MTIVDKLDAIREFELKITPPKGIEMMEGILPRRLSLIEINSIVEKSRDEIQSKGTIGAAMNFVTKTLLAGQKYNGKDVSEAVKDVFK